MNYGSEDRKRCMLKLNGLSLTAFAFSKEGNKDVDSYLPLCNVFGGTA